MSTVYRRATHDDIQEAVDIVTRMVEGTMFAPPTAEKLLRIITGPYYNEGVWLDGTLIAFMVGHVSETFLNNEVNAYEMGLFVAPEHRGTRHAVRLVRNFEDWARANGAVNIWLGQSVGQRQAETLHFFERMGYKCQGFSTCKKL